MFTFFILVVSVMVLTDCPILPTVNSSLYKTCALLKVFCPVMRYCIISSLLAILLNECLMQLSNIDIF